MYVWFLMTLYSFDVTLGLRDYTFSKDWILCLVETTGTPRGEEGLRGTEGCLL